jgi:predicted transcriptional regulator
MREMAEEKTRIDFNAPASLVERADTIADLLDVSRTRLLIDALRDELDELSTDDGVRRRIKDAYYADQIDFQTTESVLGTEEALRMKLLRASIDREPPTPQVNVDLPTQEAFYDGDVPEWKPDKEADDDAQTRA